MDDAQVDAYLDRIGADRPRRADADALRELHLRHLMAVPFENLGIHLGEDLPLEEKALLDKIVHRRRGGFCYELNGLFAALLTALGYRVELLAARVYSKEGRPGPLFDHLAIRVRTPQPHLADVGFGDHSHYPLRLDTADEQRDPGGVFTLVEAEEGDVDVVRDGRPEYRFEQRPRTLHDFEPTCWWQRTSPESHFATGTVCSLPTADGRITVSGRTLIRTAGGRRTETPLETDRELLAAYREHFGIVLGRAPAVRG